MKKLALSLAIYLTLFIATCAKATTYYVDVNSTKPSPPYADWTTAATNIQDAITAATNGDLILVTNGVYSTGGISMDGTITNRVSLNKALTVQSVNGPWVTTIQGTPGFGSGVRCAWLTNNAELVGFTLKNGATRLGTTFSQGGGVWGASSNQVFVANCIIVSNAASSGGGAAYQATLENCLVSSNWSQIPSAPISSAILYNCTVVSNSGQYGLYQVAATNCIIDYNTNSSTFNNYGPFVTLSYCCTTPLAPGQGNFTNGPDLFADGVHLNAGSLCISAGTNVVFGTDIFGQSWGHPPSVGCAQWQPSPVIANPQITLTSDPIGFTINASVTAQTNYSSWWIENGAPLADNARFSGTQTNLLVANGVLFSDAGNYQLIVSNVFGVTTSAVATLTIHCVDAGGTNAIAPYSTWLTAATNIQDAITVANAGEIVLVTNGVYSNCGKSKDGAITNRVSIDKAMLVQSVNGPAVTTIQGAWDPATNGPVSVRCAWLTNNATLSGFTLLRGSTLTGNGANYSLGGGVWGTNSTVFNCDIYSNSAGYAGGGAYGGRLLSCNVVNNSASFGGGADFCNLRQCVITGNSAGTTAGGAENCHSTNCAFTSNTATEYGSAADRGTLLNCTVSKNTGGISSVFNSLYGQAVNAASLTNCIVYGNTNLSYPTESNYSTTCTFSYSDTTPLPTGIGNISNNPALFADGIHLLAGSPVIGAGNPAVTVGTDIDGQPWNNPPSMGCDEWSAAPLIAGTPYYQPILPNASLTLTAAVTGSGLSYYWIVNGALAQDDGHYFNSTTGSLGVNGFGPADSGSYQLVISNSYGAITSQVEQLAIHVVDENATNPVPPYFVWSTAATNIQDAINVAGAGDIVLVTNGVYATGGISADGVITNRVTLTKPITVASVNGYSTTTIQGAWDPSGTNGPLAVRCVWLTNGATISGFTITHGATRAYQSTTSGIGGGVYGSSTSSKVYNCFLSNNFGYYGGGMAYGALYNSAALYNVASRGGGAYYANLYNCALVNNYTSSSGPYQGAGAFDCNAYNTILSGNYDNHGPLMEIDNYYADGMSLSSYSYCCTDPVPLTGFSSGSNNISDLSNPPGFLDTFHIAASSPCRGTGSALFATGTDLDGEAWANPPSIGCDEVVLSNLVGPLSVSLAIVPGTNLLVNRYAFLYSTFTGRAMASSWSFGNGSIATNAGLNLDYAWTNVGVYNVVFTAYNETYPNGVSTNLSIVVSLPAPPQLQNPTLTNGNFQFSFPAQEEAQYTVQYATNLTPPVIWKTLETIPFAPPAPIQVSDPIGTNAARFYRVVAQ